MSDLIYTVFSTPLGLVGIAATKKGVCRVKIGFKKETDFTRPLETAYKTPPQKNPKALRDITLLSMTQMPSSWLAWRWTRRPTGA